MGPGSFSDGRPTKQERRACAVGNELVPPYQLTSAELATARSYRPPKERGELDRWILSELNRTAAAVVERMDQYDNFNACAQLIEFVDALSNWYVRRSRDRFWSGVHDADKSDAYWTLYECLLTTAKLIAPFVPFLAEELWQNLAVAAFRREAASFNPEPTATELADRELTVAAGSGLNESGHSPSKASIFATIRPATRP